MKALVSPERKDGVVAAQRGQHRRVQPRQEDLSTTVVGQKESANVVDESGGVDRIVRLVELKARRHTTKPPHAEDGRSEDNQERRPSGEILASASGRAFLAAYTSEIAHRDAPTEIVPTVTRASPAAEGTAIVRMPPSSS